MKNILSSPKTIKVFSAVFADLTAASIIAVLGSRTIFELILRTLITIILLLLAIFFEHKA